jgi:FdhE protein
MTATRPAVGLLEDLARSDPVVARLAVLQSVALRASGDASWRGGVPDLRGGHPSPDAPVLHGRTLRADPARVRELLERLVRAAERSGVADAALLSRAVRGGVLDPLRLVEVGVSQDHELPPAEPGAGPRLLRLFAQLLALPLLHACRAAADPSPETPWDAGYCPVCGAWPQLAEARGLARERWLRCGGCGAAWRLPHHRCVFCASADHRLRGYLAAEGEREARWAEVCDRCRGYLKAVATLAPLDPAEVAARDMTTLELDVAALEAGYARPASLGFPVRVRVEPTPGPTGPLWVRLRWPAT